MLCVLCMHPAQLILRGAKLVGFNPDVARRLSQLQVLSLSHNLLASLQHFQFMESLLELNLNFNQLSSLKGLAVRGAMWRCAMCRGGGATVVGGVVAGGAVSGGVVAGGVAVAAFLAATDDCACAAAAACSAHAWRSCTCRTTVLPVWRPCTASTR